MDFETLRVRQEGAVLFADISTPPMNLLGTELVRDLQSAGTRVWLIPGADGIQHLTRLMGRARALEVMLSAYDYDAELAERYGWIGLAMSRGFQTHDGEMALTTMVGDLADR